LAGLWTIYLGDPRWGSVIGLSDRTSRRAGHWWPVESATAAEVSAAVQLLNGMALAVRTVQSIELDEPLT
jgi:hypothetical protein